MILYRGAVRTAPNQEYNTKSSVDLRQFIGYELNPHNRDYAGKLLWVTSNLRTAQGVATSRFIAKTALDEEFEKKVKEGVAKPVLIEFNTGAIKPELYEVVKSGVRRYKRGTFQMLAQDLSPFKYYTYEPSDESVRDLYTMLADREANLTVEAINSTAEIQIRSGRVDFIDSIPSDSSYIDIVRYLVAKQLSDGLSLETCMDFVAKNIYGFVHFKRELVYDQTQQNIEGQFQRLKEVL
ncbi:MAG: hypothetical protein A2W22_04185 [Candidatus Levybacteria bacterium RBG_16_35_11]|nr:MAG: hypothetical protein A2W22_04185 [Candidatus Levybacteria bacterium RBG_16_35_11]